MPNHEWTMNHTSGSTDFYKVSTAAMSTEIEVFFEGPISDHYGRIEQLLTYVIHHAHLHLFLFCDCSANVD